MKWTLHEFGFLPNQEPLDHVNEPEFRDVVDAYATIAIETARRNLARRLPEGPWLDWGRRSDDEESLPDSAEAHYH